MNRWLVSTMLGWLALGIGGSTTPAAAQRGADSTAAAAWFARHAVPIRTLDHTDSDDSDLAAIGRMIGDARVVMLGEQSHGDGTTFELKARLVKYLHRRLGFGVLAFESGLVECALADRNLAGGAPADSTGACPSRVWKDSRQVAPVLEYLAESRRGPSPLILSGIDAQPGSAAYGTTLLDALQAYLVSAGLAERPDAKAFAEHVAYLFADGRRIRSVSADSVGELIRVAGTLRDALETYRPDAADLLEGGAFWARAVDNTVGYLRFMREIDLSRPDPAVLNRRDSMMADNLLWLVRGPYAGRKIIVWGATSHLVRTRKVLEQDPAPGMIPAGQVVATALGRDVVSVGFTSSRGQTGLPYDGPMGTPRDLPELSPGTLESLIRAAGVTNGAFDLRHTGSDAAWLRRSWKARPLGHTELAADWTRMVDVLIYLDTMQPSVKR